MSDIDAVYVEIDLPYCGLDFGVSPCTATGVPCFNTRNNSHDCGDPANYTATTKTVRFVKNNGMIYWPSDDTPTFKLLSSVSSKGANLDPGESMGERAQCVIKLDNSKSLLSGLDKNIIARDDNDYYKGTFLGKFKARNPFIFGSDVRVYRGTGNGVFDVEHYVVDNFAGPNNSSGMSIKCVDFLKLTNGDSANFPAANTGQLDADISDSDTSFTVEPLGVGDLEYPASGRLAIGNEGMEFTRVGDTFTVVRGGANSLGTISDHKAGDVVQLIGEYTSERSCDMIYDWIANYSPLGSSTMDLDAWREEVDTFQNARFSGVVVEPTPVSTLINEIIQQAGLIFWADVKSRKIKLKVLRPVPSAKTLTMDSIAGGLSQQDNQRARVSQVWTYYNQKDPFKKLDERTNYYSRLVSPTLENLYPTEAIRKIYSRWIPLGGQPNAVELAARLIERYKNPPREFEFLLHRSKLAELGEGVRVQHRAIEDAFGNESSADCYITRLTESGISKTVKAKEFVFTEYSGPGGGADIVIPIEQAFVVDINLRGLYDTIRSSLAGVASVTFEVASGTVIGATTNGLYALEVGDFDGVPVSLVIKPGAFVVGKAGEGVRATEITSATGGPAFRADYPINVDNQGTIGGGGGSGGIGRVRLTSPLTTNIIAEMSLPGAGYNVGQAIGVDESQIVISSVTSGVTKAEADTAFNIASSLFFSNYGDGGDLGQDGSSGDITAGFAAGAAVTGNSNITWTNMGTILGPIS